jgi:hypothetical protein
MRLAKFSVELQGGICETGRKEDNQAAVKVIGNTPAVAPLRFIELLVASPSSHPCLALPSFRRQRRKLRR